ncbi:MULTISPECIES: contact-dependent growth inhibition system immunity protein [Pantoea]|jgi:hypothetical protein|uniref:Uncharacterized protein n=2 Tax=Enterobacterales TaxID=91347 RepID=A0A653YIG2_9GAMM|nr:MULTISPECIES: contact-dependent growth inhibition system immunity protein [Pantoea]MBZ6397831.1 hypothetical protein [Pantoea sp.]MBZ6441004.1 hypothetical protein [Pantoea sp.]MDH1088881.1 contact-dependent growth inhibition system immunity protein [Pantoea brenneri]MDU4129856.1 contact-dependent growth inhibition system immunity protein [Pantoea sp.]MDU7865559.1 contact-dependent growth inhibition system immunity protein [Pantoea sp.]
MSSYQALDTLMSGYLGPAGSYVTGTEDVSEALTYYFEHQPAHIKQELLENIEAFYADQDNINEAFERRYRHSDYDGSPQEFLSTVEARTRHDLGLQPAIAAVTTANQIVPGKTYQIRVSDNGMLGGIKRWLGYAEIGRAVMTQAAVSIGDVVEVAVAKGGNEITLNGRKRRVLNRAIRRKLNEADREPKPEKNRG